MKRQILLAKTIQYMIKELPNSTKSLCVSMQEYDITKTKFALTFPTRPLLVLC